LIEMEEAGFCADSAVHGHNPATITQMEKIRNIPAECLLSFIRSTRILRN